MSNGYNYGYLDTNMGIRRLFEGSDFLEKLGIENLSMSSYSVGEFVRTFLLDCCSLLSMLQEEKSLDDVYYRIRDMIDGDNPSNKRVGERYQGIMKLLDYPRDKNRGWAIKQLTSFIRFNLLIEFTSGFNIINSETECGLCQLKAKKIGEEYTLDLPCEMDGWTGECSVDEYLERHKGQIQTIIHGTREVKIPYFRKLGDLIDSFFTEGTQIGLAECKTLGDVIVSLDCPEDHTMVTGDLDVSMICDELDIVCEHIPSS